VKEIRETAAEAIMPHCALSNVSYAFLNVFAAVHIAIATASALKEA
jgi:hypothetical protein